ncbi:MAG: hypothetical protein AB7K24_33140, partial [Gemmataceae bacterium]
MATRFWTFDLDNHTHRVWLEHGFWSGKKEIRLDDMPIELPPQSCLVDTGGDFPFPVGDNHRCVVHIRTNGLTYSYDCTVDGVSVETGTPTYSPEAVRRNRDASRMIMCGYTMVVGLVCLLLGSHWRLNGIPLNYVGGFLLVFGFLGLVGLNIFRHGPLDKRDDPVD